MAGGASIITFPVLLAMGVPPLTANVTNTVGLSPIVIGTGLGALPELRGQRARLTALAPPSLVGALAGAVLLLTTPISVFEAIVPALIAISCLLMLLQPWLVRHTLRGAASAAGGGWRRRARSSSGCTPGTSAPPRASCSSRSSASCRSRRCTSSTRRRTSSWAIANAVATVMFAFVAPVRWPMALALAAGSVVGGGIGTRLVRRVPAPHLRAGIAVVGLVVAVRLAV